MLEECEHLEEVRIYCAELSVLFEAWFAFPPTRGPLRPSISNKSRSASVNWITLYLFWKVEALA
jgi:hypothetical protein